MKKLSALLIILVCSTLIACSNGMKINGHNARTAYKSVKVIKNRLPAEQRIEFEVSFWTIRDSFKDDGEFLAKVDGKEPQEVINLGKELYQERKNAGYEAYKQYSSWDEMIAKFGQERIDQEKTRREDPRDRANNVLYKLK
ncbi:hypothetical protein [Methylobacter sp. YRD-M1]|uniref:hypothetical protein n=1 Tax=Methylobacter sp. YRD-M1 TaxID=2911520 RepID=UPI00227A42B3|nr:hypothetical protein [Methylobacter sp. YRD-M1]WAK03971.1 hypothetical protein LZ558_09340 [Methylobacter sp. YRD-M1]